MISIYSLESHTNILVFFLLKLYAKPQYLVMLEWIQLIFRGNIVYMMVIMIMRNCYHGDYLESYYPTKPAICIFSFY